MTNPPTPKNTSAFFVQAAVSFGLAAVGVIGGEVYLPIDGWPRAFLVLGTIFLVTSSFTLAKVIRDAQEGGNVVNRLDQARLERLLAEFDPYKVPDLPSLHVPVAQQYPPYPSPAMASPAQPQAA
jgi:hypothetical protein